MDFNMGNIVLFGGSFAPKEWAFCHGQLAPISQNQALFAILGTTWGGDGRTTYGLPDMRGRVPIGTGQGPGLTDVREGEKWGIETQALQIPQMPAHTHSATFRPSGGSAGTGLTANVTVNAASTANADTPSGNYWADAVSDFGGETVTTKNFGTSSSVTMASDAVQVSISGSTGGITGGTVIIGQEGGASEFSIMQPTLGINYIIAIEGTFPARN